MVDFHRPSVIKICRLAGYQCISASAAQHVLPVKHNQEFVSELSLCIKGSRDVGVSREPIQTVEQ